MAVLSSIMFTCYLIIFVLLENIIGKSKTWLGYSSWVKPVKGTLLHCCPQLWAEWSLTSPSTVCSPDCCLDPCHIVIHLPGHLPQQGTSSFGAESMSCVSLYPQHLVSEPSKNIYHTIDCRIVGCRIVGFSWHLPI